MQALINRITRRGQVHQAEEQTSFWAKDSEFKACYGCDAEFTFFLRKHHCRMCGGIHCDRCSSNYLPPQAFEHINASTHQRCCNRCARSYEAANGLPQGTFSSYGARGTAGASTSSVSARNSDASRASRPPKPAEASPDRPPRTKMVRSNSSRSMAGQQGRPTRPELSGLSISRGPSLSSQQLPDPGGSTAQSGATKSQGDSGAKAKSAEAASSKDPALIWEEPAQMPADYGTHCLSAHPSRPGMGRQQVQSGETLSWFESQHLSGQPTTGFADEQRISLSAVGKSKGEIPSVSRDIRRGLSVVACDHLQRMISQLLHVEQISARDVWLPVLHRLAMECSLLLSAAAINKRRNIDPREYVKVKKVPDNSDPSASRVVQGLVFSKNLTHRSMRREIQNARVLLLQGALEYHRQDRLLTLQTLTTQEPEYMRMSIQKACRFRPDIILVEKSVARIAQESLLNANVSLAINVKYTTLDRIAQCSRVQVASHLDELTQNNIIHCQAFRVEEVPPRILQPGEAAPKNASAKHRTLMYIEGTVEGLGCTVLLRGASEAELYRIKRIMRTAVYAAYCARLEVAFLADVCTALSLTINPMVQRAAAERQAAEAAAGASAGRSSLATERLPIEPQACKPLPLMQGRLAATWEEWGKQIGEACRTTETPVMSISPYVKKWLVGRTGEDTDGGMPANGSSGLVVTRTSQDGRGSQVEDVVHIGTQAMAHVYYDQVTQVSYSFRNFKGKLVCQPPSVQKYSHYGRHDQSLVKFLNGCQPSRCEQCGDFSTLHTRQYLHGGQLLAVSFYKGHKGHVDGHDDTVWLWVRVKNRPEVQKQDCGKIKLSTSAQCLSFAHFLELMCSMTSLAVEGATLNRDVVLYFKIRHFIVCVNPNRIRPFEMVIPSQPVDCEVEAYGKAIQHEAVNLIMEVRSMFENLQSQLSSLRMLVSSADARTGKPQSVGSPTRGRSKSVAVVPEVTPAEPSPHVQQAERLFDLWQERMEEDHNELREEIRAASHAVDTVDDVQGHPALQEARFLGIHSLSQPGKRLISLHLKLISLRCSYTKKIHMWSGELIAFSRALRGRVPTESGSVKAALTSAGVLDANGSAAVSPRSPFDDDEVTMLGMRRVHSSDVEGAVSALLANHNSSARELLGEGPRNPLRVTITFNVITLPPSDATGPESHQEDGKEYVEVLMHAYEAGEWTAPRANIFSSAFESRANSSAKGGESPPRVDSNNSGAMPVVSLRVGMGPDLGLMASTPVPGEAGSEQASAAGASGAEAADKHAGSSPSPLKAVATAGKPRPTSASSSKSATAPKSPLSGEAVSRSDLQARPKDGSTVSGTTLTAASLSSRPPYGTTDSGAALTRQSSAASSMTEASDGTVIVHKEGSGATVGDHSVRVQLQRDAATQQQSAEQQSPQRSPVGADRHKLHALRVEAPAADATPPASEGSPSVTGLQETDGPGLPSPTTTPSHGPAPSELDHADVALSGDGSEEGEGGEQAAAAGSRQGSHNVAQMTESTSIGGASLGGSSISAHMSGHALEPPAVASGRRTGSFSGFPEASGLSQGTTVPQYPDVGWMRSTNSEPASGPTQISSPGAADESKVLPELEAAPNADPVQGDSAPTSPPAPQSDLPQHISLSSAFASGGRCSSETGGPTAASSAIVSAPQLGGESPFAAEGRQDDAHCSAAGVLAHGAPRVSAGTDITQALSSRSSNPMSARPGGSVNGEGQESRSPSLRRSMSTGDEHELREAMIPSLLQCGIKESNIDWFMSKLNKDRAIDRTYTEDRILEGLSGWHTHLAGDEANTRAAPPPPRETISPLGSLTAHLPLPSRNQVLSKSGSQARSSAAGPSFGPSPSDSAALQAGEGSAGDSSTAPAAATKSNAAAHTEDADTGAADAASAAAAGTQDSNKPGESTGKADAAVAPTPVTKEPLQANAQAAMQTPFSTVSSLQGRGSQSMLPEAAGAAHRTHGTASLPATSSLPSKGGNYQGIHSRAASLVGPASGPAPLTYPDVKSRLLGPGIADMHIPIFMEEPTTAAAYFLTTPEYHEQLARIREEFVAPPKGGHGAAASEHPSGPAHTHTSSRSDAQGTTPRSATAENSTPAFGSPTQSNITELANEGLVAAHLDTASQPEPHSTYQDDSLSATGSIPTAPSPSYAATGDHQSAWPASEDLRLLRSSQNKSITLEFPANTSSSSPHNDSNTKFTVVAYYAAQFAELRKRVVAGGELAFLLSLSRCNRWKPKGGKTMAYFAKTHDERYVVKSLSRSEKASFLEFAPHYLAHLTNMLETNIPSCLSKVLGFFQITMSNEWKGDIIIMEHVFYEKTLSRSFDLKGTGRNPAKTGSSSSPNDSSSIMLDDQLKQSTFQRPLIVAPHERSKLMAALRSDTQFLAKVGVMDYSLLLGVDRVNQRLIVGIIDYIRQYTWDKHVENWVKMSGIMPGPKKEPTVISPKQYMKRFIKAMDQYFTITPFANKISWEPHSDESPAN